MVLVVVPQVAPQALTLSICSWAACAPRGSLSLLFRKNSCWWRMSTASRPCWGLAASTGICTRSASRTFTRVACGIRSGLGKLLISADLLDSGSAGLWQGPGATH